MGRFELPASRTPSERATRLRHIPSSADSISGTGGASQMRRGDDAGLCSAPVRAGLGLVGFEEEEEVAELVAQAVECGAAVVGEARRRLRLKGRGPGGVLLRVVEGARRFVFG